MQSDIFLLPNIGPTEGGPTKHSVFSYASSALGVITNRSSQKKRTWHNEKQLPWEWNAPVLIWKWRIWVQLCISSEGSLTVKPSFLLLFATTKRAISFWLTGPEDQKTTGNPNAALGQSHTPYHGKTSGDETFGVDQVCFHFWRRSKAFQDLEEWPKGSIWLHRDEKSVWFEQYKCWDFIL